MNKIIVALISGIIFGLGLTLSQMVNPDKVISFLDIAGDWDPSLAFVMAGALAVAMPGFYWLIKKRGRPVFEDAFHLSHKTQIDKPLVLGSIIFGIGWGMSGYCPGPAVAGIGLGNTEAMLMVAAIYAGFFAQRFMMKK
jgi:uncharacterized membrane protein YedE/YeeE